MLFKTAINENAQITPITKENNGLMKFASRFADINSFDERYKRLFANYITAHSLRVGEYNPEFKYYRVIALHGDVPNANGDMFEWGNADDETVPELLRYDDDLSKYVYSTFTGRGNYLNHDNDDVLKAVGIVLDVAPNETQKHIEALLAVDTKKTPSLIRDIDTGLISKVSMGALCGYSICSVCGQIARTADQYCEHIKYSKMKQVHYQGEYKLAYEINRNVNFIELSWVNIPADAEATLLEKVASSIDIFKYATENLDNDKMNHFLSYAYGFLENKLQTNDTEHLYEFINSLKNN